MSGIVSEVQHLHTQYLYLLSRLHGIQSICSNENDMIDLFVQDASKQHSRYALGSPPRAV